MIMYIKCKNCKIEFVKPHPNTKYCSNECYYKKRKSTERSRKYAKQGYKGYGFIECLICGSLFKKVTSTNKYCSGNCEKKARKKRKNTWQKKYHKRNKKNPEYILKRVLRTCLNGYVKKRQSSSKYCNFTAKEFEERIEKMFAPGMGWENWVAWNVDHIKPLASFNFYKNGKIDWNQAYAANSLNNLQPLWAKDNLKKHSKVNYDS